MPPTARPHEPRPFRRRGFTLIDTAVTVGVAGVIAALAAVGLERSRQAQNEALCAAKLGAIGAGSASFAMSSNDLMAGFTWEQGGASSQFPDLNTLQSQSQLGAHAAQAIDILRRRGRPDIPAGVFFAEINFWSLVLADFEGRSLSDAFNVCPTHDILNKWRRHPAAFDAGVFGVRQPAPGPATRRWPYSSSYRLTGAAFDRNQTVFTSVAPSRRVSFGTSHASFAVPAAASLGPSTMATVATPSLKVHAMDSHGRHMAGAALYFAYPDSRQPVLFFDGSVAGVVSGESVAPWHPANPNSGVPQNHLYTPAAWEPPTQSGAASQSLPDRLQWTRNGLHGRDF
jgi:hypothetical protein